MLLTSYALENGLDIREAVITLDTYDNNGLNIIASTEMIIKQYNAIIIDTDKGKRGFARYDWGTKRNLNTGEIDYSGEQSIWGYYTIGTLGVYYGSTDGNIFGKAGGSSNDNGEDNYYDAKETAGSDPDKDLYKGFYGGCAIYKCGVKYLQVENSVKQSLDKIWYLPARFELQSFLKNEYENIIIGERYWTSTARVEDTYCNSRDIKGDLFDDKNIAWVSKSVRRDNKYYMRQACIISENNNIMKQYTYIIILLFSLLAACQDDLEQSVEDEYPSDGKTTFVLQASDASAIYTRSGDAETDEVLRV